MSRAESEQTSGVCVDARGLRRVFGPKVVLSGLDFTAEPEEFVAIVGRSGSGKSTLLRLLAGLDQPDGGRVLIDGTPLTGLCRAARIVFQDGRLLPWQTVGQNVALGLPPGEVKFAMSLLERVALADRANDWPAVLSGGQRQRVALARALASRPRLLLLDEPLGSLDALTRIEMQQLVESLWLTSAFTEILITHDVEEAVALADRVVYLNAGRVEGEWRIDLPRPRHRGHPAFAALVEQILDVVLQQTSAPALSG